MTWNFYKNGAIAKPLKWKGGDQLSVRNELVKKLTENDNRKMIKFVSTCGSGKSAIAISAISEIGKNGKTGKGIIVVPNKVLQRQYYDDYFKEKYYFMKNGKKVKISMMCGRGNFKCLFMKNVRRADLYSFDNRMKRNYVTCNDLEIPCRARGSKSILDKIEMSSVCPYFTLPPIHEKLVRKFISNGIFDDIKNMLNIRDVILYNSYSGRFAVFIKRGKTCPYYEQFYSYIDSDIIVMNTAKWETETYLLRKPVVDVEIIDEADEYLRTLSKSFSISANWINTALSPCKKKAEKSLEMFYSAFDKIHEHNKVVEVYKCKEFVSFIKHMKDVLTECSEGQAFDISENEFMLRDILRFSTVSVLKSIKTDRTRYIDVYIIRPDIMFNQILANSSKNIVLMSVTMYSDFVLDNVYGLTNLINVKGREDQPGTLKLIKPKNGLIDVTFNNLNNESFKKKYTEMLKDMINNLKRNGNVLVLTTGRRWVMDLIKDFMDSDNESDLDVDFIGSDIKNKNAKVKISYKKRRGVDYVDDACRGIIWTKYPIPDMSSVFIQYLRSRFDNETFWRIIDDIALNEIVQGCCRGLRHDADWCYVTTPDRRAYNKIRKWWSEQMRIKKKRMAGKKANE